MNKDIITIEVNGCTYWASKREMQAMKNFLKYKIYFGMETPPYDLDWSNEEQIKEVLKNGNIQEH